MEQAPRIIEGRFTRAEPSAQQTAKPDAYSNADAKTRPTD
jgi:hypothetical protein